MSKLMNTTLLTQIRDHILEEPKRVTMEDWLQRIPKEWVTDRDPACGTIGCIAGWAVVLGLPRRKYVYNVSTTARGVLELSVEEARWLFYVGGWPNQFRESLHTLSPRTPEYAAVVAKRIDYFIKYGA